MTVMKMEALSSLLLVSLLIALLAQWRMANAQLLPSPPSLPGGLFPPGTAPDVLKCWSSLTGVNGCVMEILQSVASLQFGSISADCCKAFVAVEDSCLPKMFPLTPFPPLLRNICARQGAPTPKILGQLSCDELSTEASVDDGARKIHPMQRLMSAVDGLIHIREFKAVCQSWRAAAISCSSYVPLPRTPCLLLHGETQNSFLFDPIGKKKHEIRNVHDYTPRARCVGSSYGWIVMFYEDNELKEFKSKAHLFNPITRGRISIPGDHHNLPNCTSRKAIISSNPSFNKNFDVVVQFGFRLAYYKHGDEDMSWKMLKVDVDGADYNYDEDFYGDKGFVFHDNLLVALGAFRFTNVWDFKKYPPLHLSFTKNSSTAKFFTYLMESSLTGDILGLTEEGENSKTLKFGVEKLDLQKGKWENLQSLGDQSLFFFRFFGGRRQWQLMSMVNPCFLGCEKNSIYFAMRELDKSASLDKYAIYDLQKGKIKNMGEEAMVVLVLILLGFVLCHLVSAEINPAHLGGTFSCSSHEPKYKIEFHPEESLFHPEDDQESVVMPDKNGQNFICYMPKVEEAKSGKPFLQQNLAA
ncbi:hypothetical protein ACLB2K_002673 [Fragaria x ananassa]